VKNVLENFKNLSGLAAKFGLNPDTKAHFLSILDFEEVSGKLSVGDCRSLAEKITWKIIST